jgi:septal ring factor EnvC (AmiA/AmiB activator)
MTFHDEPGHTIPLPVHGPEVAPESAVDPARESAASTTGGEGSRRPTRRWPSILAWALVAACVVSLGVLGYGYKQSLDSSRDWKALADSTTSQLESTRGDLDRTAETLTKTKTALDDTRKALDETKGNLKAVAGQYNDASERIRQLANEKAKVGDQAGMLSTAVEQAGRLQEQLDACVTGLRDLQTYLVNAGDYDPDSLAKVVAQVNAGCDEAQSQSKAFQEWLKGQ